MNKLCRLLCGILAAALLLSACGTIPAPKPTEVTGESAPNASGWRFSFDLDTLSDRVNRSVMNLDAEGSGSLQRITRWAVLSHGLVDDTGLSYTSYCIRGERFTLTAAVEDESGKVMNLGCGCVGTLLEDAGGKRDFITMTAVLAVQAGGFTDEDIPFLRQLIGDLLDGEAAALCYESVLYSESEDKDSVVIILSPCDPAQAKSDGVPLYRSEESLNP